MTIKTNWLAVVYSCPFDIISLKRLFQIYILALFLGLLGFALNSVKQRFFLLNWSLPASIDLCWIVIIFSARPYQVQIDGVLSARSFCLVASCRFSYWSIALSVVYFWSACCSRWFCFPFCKLLENYIPPPQSNRLSPFLPPWPGRGNGTYRSTPSSVHVSQVETSLPFSVFLRGWRQPSNCPGYRRPRYGGSPWHDFNLVS